MFMWMWAAAAADDSLIPGERPPPPLLRPTFVWADRQGSDRGETSGNPLNALRFLGAVKRFVQSIQIWQSFPCSTLQLGFLWTCLDNEPLYLSHLVSFSRLTLCLVWVLDSTKSYAPQCCTFLSLQIRGTGGHKQLLWKRQETGKQV